MAVKILSAHATSMQGSVAFEMPILQRIRDAYGSAGNTHIVSLRDAFTVTSVHGEHACLVTDVLGSTLKAHLTASGGRVSVPVAKKLTGQLLTALSKLHAAGIVHTGAGCLSP